MDKLCCKIVVCDWALKYSRILVAAAAATTKVYFHTLLASLARAWTFMHEFAQHASRGFGASARNNSINTIFRSIYVCTRVYVFVCINFIGVKCSLYAHHHARIAQLNLGNKFQFDKIILQNIKNELKILLCDERVQSETINLVFTISKRKL